MTTENRRADALTDARILEIAETVGVPDTATDDVLVKFVRACLTASTALQPAAAPIDDARECLMDVVSHHDNIVAGFAAQRLAAQEAQDSDSAAYWNHEIDVAHRMKAQAERALAAMVRAAPSPADERAAIEPVVAWINHPIKIVDGEFAGYEKPEVSFTRAANGYDFDKAEPLYRRAASANETGAEGATDLEERAHLAAGQWANSNTPIAEALAYRDGFIAGARSPAMAVEAVDWRELSRRLYVELFHCDQQMRSTRDEDGEPHWTQSTVVRDVLADAKTTLDAAPQPAQADARVGLTDEQILNAFRDAGIDLNATPNMAYTVRGQQAQLVNAVRALLQGANQ